MMTYKIIYTQKALADLDAVASYIKLKLCNISASDRIIENFSAKEIALLLFRLFIPYVTTHFACVGNPLRARENLSAVLCRARR